MKNSNPSLSAYMTYVSEEGIDLHRFVEHGGRLLGPDDAADLAAGMDALREKIATVRDLHPRFARQLGFLVEFLENNPVSEPDPIRNESLFALLYALKEMDLMPDDMPEVGYLDDAAVTEVVLTRHAREFERYCESGETEWDAVAPGSSP